jgi:glycosyltransferase involved in cell wall biosynthesis
MRARRPFLKRATFALIESRILRHAAAVHCTSATELREVEELGVPFRGVVIPLGVEEIRRHGGGRKSGAQAAKTVLFLSRLDRVKNLESLLRAIALPGPSSTGVRLLVAGDGEVSYVAELRDLARSLGLTQRVEWLGHVTGAAKEEVFGRADIFVQPSLSESFGVAAVEAMLAGLPCVLNDGVAIAAEAGRASAVRVCAQTPESLGEAIMDLLVDDVAARSLGERGAAFARKNYSVESMGDKLIALYKDLKGDPLGGR